MPWDVLLDHVPPVHRTKLTLPLDTHAVSALRMMGQNKLLQPVMSDETKASLVEAGYIRHVLGGVTMTDLGEVRALMEASR